RAPGFTVVAVATLTLGIGANSAMFGVVDALLFRPPEGVADPQRVVRMQVQLPTRGAEAAQLSDLLSYPDFVALREQARGFEAVAAFVPATRPVGVGDAAQSELCILASGSYFPALAVKPALGRLLDPNDDRDDAAAAVAVLSWDYWQRAYAGAPAVLGRTIRVGGRPFTIVGVAPRHFVGSELARPALWLPLGTAWQLGFDRQLSGMQFGVWLSAIARLSPGVTREQAVDGAGASLQIGRAGGANAAPPGKVAGGSGSVRVNLTSLAGAGAGASASADARPERALPVSLWFLGITGVVLLIACANVANLLLARATQRGHELAVRASIGASRGRLVRQLLTESTLLAALGGISGLALALAGTSLLPRLMPLPPLPPLLGGRLLAFTVLLTVATIVLFGIAPSVRAARADLAAALNASVHRGGPRSTLRSTLVVVQLAASVVLLVSAGLFVRSLRNVKAIDPGFAVERLLVVSGATRSAPLTQQDADAFWGRALERVRGLSGVRAAALGAALPFEEVYMMPVSVPGGVGGPLTAQPDFADSAYFATLGVPLREGRPFTAADQHPDAAPVVIINQALSRQLFGGESALGRCIRAGPTAPNATCAQVVGVTANANYADVTRQPTPLFYRPLGARDARGGWGTVLHVRTQGEPAGLAAGVRRALLALDPSLLYVRVRPLSELLAPQRLPWRTGTLLFTLFGALGLVLAAIGLYGVIALLVVQRTHEMGVRVALGARRWDVVRLLLEQSARLVVAGLVIGALGAAAASRLFATMMYGVTGVDPVAYVATGAILALVALVAVLVPARRATKVDPTAALRAN
ncbi:MAG: ADOP family duplicated permease, partial [Gemmatimonadaceae bacterium]